MRTVVELMETTVRLLTDSSKPSSCAKIKKITISRYLVQAVTLGYFHRLIMELKEMQYMKCL